METAESPLDVLSRAATMVQDSSPPDYDCTRSCKSATKELPTGRWRRERRDKPSARLHHRATPDAPLDMTTSRGMPPPYSQCVSSRPARSSVITCVPTRPAAREQHQQPAQRREQMSDPVIDEHFRRSLGNDYNHLFQDETASSITVTGLSVDDHFAKALGDTWVKLQKSEPDSSTVKREDSKQKQKPANSGPSDPTSRRRGLVTI